MNKKLNCVLLVDDDDATNYLSKMVIDITGVTDHIEVALNGKEALEFLTRKGKYGNGDNSYPKPDLILLDINMPVMDGWEFMAAYHNLDEIQKSKIIIVMITTSFNPDDKKRAESISEIAGFRHKPLTVEMFEEILKKHFPDIWN